MNENNRFIENNDSNISSEYLPFFESIDESYFRTEQLFQNIFEELVHELEMTMYNKRKILSSEEPPSKKKKRKNFDLDSRKVLKEWLMEHIDNPYPSKKEKTELSKTSNLSEKQINTWFSNGRQRYLKKEEIRKKSSKKRKKKKK